MTERALDGQVAVVTGASRGIGRAIALALGQRGAKVVVSYRSGEEEAATTARQLEQMGAEAMCERADVGEAGEAESLIARTLERFERLDVLVNNAGIQRSAMAHRMSDDDWHEVMATNLSGPFFTSRAALRWMRKARQGHIINIASASAHVGQAGAASYVASKHGLIGLTKALALEGASANVRVNAVSPGLTETDLVSALDESQRAELMKRVPLGRIASPDEVAEMVAWVACAGSYSTGNVFHVSGGVAMG